MNWISLVKWVVVCYAFRQQSCYITAFPVLLTSIVGIIYPNTDTLIVMSSPQVWTRTREVISTNSRVFGMTWPMIEFGTQPPKEHALMTTSTTRVIACNTVHYWRSICSDVAWSIFDLFIWLLYISYSYYVFIYLTHARKNMSLELAAVITIVESGV